VVRNKATNKVNFNQTFKNKKVFVTGHTGFKGAWLVLWLETLGAKVKGYALKPNTKPSLFDALSKKLHCESVIADIRNKEKLTKEILAFQPDFVFHLAAQPLVRESYEIPVETFEVNTIGTANLLNAVRALKKVCTVVVVTTDKVYHNNEWHFPYRESDRLGGYDPYSASKAATEIVVESFRSSFFNPNDFAKHKKAVATARAGNVIGGGDFAKDRIVPDVFRALSKNKTVEVRNPNAVRPWQHVLEPLSGYLQLAALLQKHPQQFSQAYNFGPNLTDTLPVGKLVELSIGAWGKGNSNFPPQKNALHEAGLLKLDISKAVNELQWQPKWSAQMAIEKTINWYKNSLAKNADAYQLCLKDLETYQKK
jgi:CDP-glucose 4,6-dehydratase